MLGIYGIRLVALYGLFVGGCTGPAGPAAAPTPTTAAPPQVPVTTSAPPISPAGRVVTMRCSEVVARRQPAASDVVLGAVALPTRTTLHAGHSGENGWMVAKRGLDLRAEVAVELLVAPAAAGRARIGWGAGGRMGTHVRWPGCAPETGWLAFAGAYQVDAPMCVPLVVRSGGREAQVGVGVGVGCPPG